MRSFASLFFLPALATAASAQIDGMEFIDGLIAQFIQTSPTTFLHNWAQFSPLPVHLRDFLHLVGSAAKTKSEEMDQMVESSPLKYNCNLTDVSPECFLQYLAVLTGEGWGTQNEDAVYAKELIDKYLSPNKNMAAALFACITASKTIPMFSGPAKKIEDVSEHINAAKAHCAIRY